MGFINLKDRRISRIISAALAFMTISTSIPLNNVYAEENVAEETVIEAEDTVNDEASVSDNDSVSEDSTYSENSLVSGNSVSENTVSSDSVSDNKTGEFPVCNYIEMPWDKNAATADDDLDYKDAVDSIVDDNSLSIQGYKVWMPDNLKVVSEPASIDAKYPEGDEKEILNYLKETFPATRSQSPYGSCWAHSAIALTEFYMISHGLNDAAGPVDKNVNYSELQLAYFCYNKAPAPVNGETGDNITFDKNGGNGDSFLDFGGNINFASQSLMRYNGVVDDDGDAAYSNAGAVIESGLSDEYARSKDMAHLENEYMLNIKENPKLVKEAIKENGIVGISYYAKDDYINNETNAYYCSAETKTNHAVTLVGWDDDYPASNFLTDPESDGAWLVRNSWTTKSSFSVYSYFWLSYYDKSLNDTAYVFEMADNSKAYDNNYNYDAQLHNVVTADSKKVANIFTAVKNAETLKAVQIDSTMNAPGDYTVYVYKNPTDPADPESGTKVTAATTTGTLPFEGKYTINLTSDVKLSQGEVFSVVVETEKNIDREYDFEWNDQIKMDTAINEGESFAYINGAWKDLSERSSNGKIGNICVRALTNTNGEASLPEKISTLSAKNKTDSSISLTWSAADADSYEIYYSASESGEYTKAGETDSSVRKFTHTGLEAGRKYYYKVYPVKDGVKNETGVSPTINVTTLSATPEVEVSDVGAFTAIVKWRALDNCDGYEYRYMPKGSNGYIYGQISDTEARLSGLTPETSYLVKVGAYKNDGNEKIYGDFSDEIEITTMSGTGSAVTDLKAEPYGSSSVKLKWDTQDEVKKYIIERSTDNKNFVEVNSRYPWNRTEYIASGLDPNTKYYFRLTSVFNDNVSYTADAVSSYTKLPASNVTNIEASKEEESISISWSSVT
ncbi:MAG: fibronectin type III domain-containing protein, partial [Lachnospiraceae bacterium]|nr:fibronectin type III domain-containing protein [Lachnospiraceae bacterium]